jgi:hypothetical protein
VIARPLSTFDEYESLSLSYAGNRGRLGNAPLKRRALRSTSPQREQDYMPSNASRPSHDIPLHGKITFTPGC